MVDIAASRSMSAASDTPDTGLDDAVAAMMCGDEVAFARVYRALQPGLLRYLTVLVGREDAEDIASETWSHAVRDRARFRGQFADFRAWVTTIGRHRALDHLRRVGRRPVADRPSEEVPECADPADTENDVMDRLSTRSALVRIAALPAEQAEAILLRVVIGLDAKRAGAVLGRRPGAVRTAAHRGLRTLHEQIAAVLPQ